jgi:hypothetical protein
MHFYYSNIWFASQEKMQGLFKGRMFSDRGRLEIREDSIKFQGEKNSIQMYNIQRIALVHQRWPWGDMLVSSGLFSLCVALFVNPVGHTEAPSFEQILKFKLALFMGALGLFLLASLLVFVIGKGRAWIAIDYQEEDKVETAYFVDGTIRLWGDNTKEIFDNLHSSVQIVGKWVSTCKG